MKDILLSCGIAFVVSFAWTLYVLRLKAHKNAPNAAPERWEDDLLPGDFIARISDGSVFLVADVGSISSYVGMEHVREWRCQIKVLNLDLKPPTMADVRSYAWLLSHATDKHVLRRSDMVRFRASSLEEHNAWKEATKVEVPA